MTSKIVVLGELKGRFREVFQKVSALHAKNAFSLALVVGNLFAEPSTATADDDKDVGDLLNGKIQVPVSCYFALGTSPLPSAVIEKLESNDGELCENLFFLGKRTIFKTSEGLRIVALGGVQASLTTDDAALKDKYQPVYKESDANGLKGANSADILITNEWPAQIRRGSKATLPTEVTEPMGQRTIAELCATLKPRYHFSTSPEVFVEREPFFYAPTNPGEGFATTRFISLASYGNAGKQKWIYAFSIEHSPTLPLTVPPGATASPFTLPSKKRAVPSDGNTYSRFSTSNYNHHSHRTKRHHRGPPPGPESCYFCLSNPNLALHLIASIGTEAYLTTAKGPLTTATTFSGLAFPAHILIMPLAHTPTLTAISSGEERQSTLTEMHRYRLSLDEMLVHRNAAQPDQDPLGSVTWEVSRAGGIHTHWQWLPVLSSMISRGLVETAFKVEAENEGLPEVEVDTQSPSTSIKEDTPITALIEESAGSFDAANEPTADVLRLWLWAPSPSPSNDLKSPNTPRTILTLPIPAPSSGSTKPFNLILARQVLAKLLRLEHRTNWRADACAQSAEEEEAECEAFKAFFGKEAGLDFAMA